jgi:hypothetical protein
MRRIFLPAILAALATSAHASLFTNGATFTINTQNSPDNASDTVTFTPGLVQSLDDGDLTVTIDLVDAGGGKEWVVFNYHATDSFLSNGAVDWSIEQVGIPTAVATNFIADFTQWTDANGATITQTGGIFGQTIGPTPVPGYTGNGEGSSGFTAPFPAGPLPQLGAFADPFSIVINGLGGVRPTGFTQALEFEAQNPTGTPEPQTWAMMLMGFVGLGFLAARRCKPVAAAI